MISLQLNTPRVFVNNSSDNVGTCALHQEIESWEHILHDDLDKSFILDGIRHGFKIVDDDIVDSPVEDVYCKNYKSVLQPSVRDKVESQIVAELEANNYVLCNAKPTIVSSLGAVPKDNDKLRLIHDCSRPVGQGVNSYATNVHFKYQTVDQAVKILPDRGFMAKIDLSSAYRSVPIHPSCYKFMGISWHFKGDTYPSFIVDTRLCFGASLAPGIFQRITNSVCRYMAKCGYTVLCYLDDFLVIDATKRGCERGYELLLEVLQKLGFKINWNKVQNACQVITFLGVEINSVESSLSLPEKKLLECKELLKYWKEKKKATKHELQILIGKLNWAAKVVKGGRIFLRRLITVMCSLKRKNHHVRLNKSARLDIEWWANCIEKFNGTAFFTKEQLPSGSFSTDACTNGGGGSYDNDWFYANWELDYPEIQPLHINLKELYAVFLACQIVEEMACRIYD